MGIAPMKPSSNANRTEVVEASREETTARCKTAAATMKKMKIANVTETVLTAMVMASDSKSAIATVTAQKANVNSKSASKMEVDARTMKTVTAMATATAPEKAISSANRTEVVLEERGPAVREFVEESV
jgi:hypothetical protein